MTGQAEIFHAFRQFCFGDILSFGRGRHQKFISQFFERIAAIEEGRFQNGVFHHSHFHGGAVNSAAEAILQQGIAAVVVGIGVGIDDGGQLPALGIQDFLDLSAGVLIVAAVDEPHIVIADAVYADFGRGVDIVCIFCYLYQFVHGQNLLCFCGTLSHTLQGDNPLDLICKN